MTSVLYASLLALLICYLSLKVIKQRRSNKISLGDGGVEELRIAIAAHANAVEYIPIFLLLLFALEYNQAGLILVHAFGIAFLVGRVLHAHGILTSQLRRRVLGMQITLYSIIALAITNFLFLPYNKLLDFY